MSKTPTSDFVQGIAFALGTAVMNGASAETLKTTLREVKAMRGVDLDDFVGHGADRQSVEYIRACLEQRAPRLAHDPDEFRTGVILSMNTGSGFTMRWRTFLRTEDGFCEVLGLETMRGRFIGQVGPLATVPDGIVTMFVETIDPDGVITSVLGLEALTAGAAVVAEATGKTYTRLPDGKWLGQGDETPVDTAFFAHAIDSGLRWLEEPSVEDTADDAPAP